MTPRFMSRRARFVPCLLLVLGACDDPEMPVEENPDQPNANELVYSNQFGGTSGYSDVYNLQNLGGTLYFNGHYRSHATFGRLDGSNGLVWHREYPGRVRDFAPFDGDRLVVVGRDNSSSIRGSVRLVSSNGEAISEQFIASDSSGIALSGIAPLSDSQYVVVGSDSWDGKLRPMYAYVSVAQDGTLQVGHPTVIGTIAHFFHDVVVPANDPSGDFFALYALPDGFSIMRIQRDGAIVWDQPVRVGGSLVDIDVGDVLVSDGDNLYVAGQTFLRQSGNWNKSVGFVASMDLTGETRWVTRASYSKAHDLYRALAVSGERVYAVGRVSGLVSFGKNFGYALLAEYDRNTGELAKWFSFGRTDAYMEAAAITLIDGEPVLGGYTQRDYHTNITAWVARLDDTRRVAVSLGSECRAAGEAGVRAPAATIDKLP